MDASWDTSASLFPDEPTLRDVCFCNHDQIYLVLSATGLEDFHGMKEGGSDQVWLDDNDYLSSFESY